MFQGVQGVQPPDLFMLERHERSFGHEGKESGCRID